MVQQRREESTMTHVWQYRPGFGWVERTPRQIEEQRDARYFDETSDTRELVPA
jgi:hypothetical protein